MEMALKGTETQGVSGFPAWMKRLVQTLKLAEVRKRTVDYRESCGQAVE
jgi:hypothetical protein